MKKIAALICPILFLAMTTAAMAAGTLSGGAGDWTQISKKNWKKTVTWVDDGTGTTGTITVPPGLRGAYLFCMLTDPGATAPTDNYGIRLNMHDVDYLGGNGANRDTANSEVAFPATATRVLDDDFAFVLYGNSVNGALGSVTIYIYTD
jgi:hypothetical protein